MSGTDAKYVVTVFRSRLRPDAAANGYYELSGQIDELARAAPGFVDAKTFDAEDGERVTIVTFDSMEHQRAWRDDPGHRAAQQRGIRDFYAEYDISVCERLSHRTFHV